MWCGQGRTHHMNESEKTNSSTKMCVFSQHRVGQRQYFGSVGSDLMVGQHILLFNSWSPHSPSFDQHVIPCFHSTFHRSWRRDQMCSKIVFLDIFCEIEKKTFPTTKLSAAVTSLSSSSLSSTPNFFHQSSLPFWRNTRTSSVVISKVGWTAPRDDCSKRKESPNQSQNILWKPTKNRTFHVVKSGVLSSKKLLP